MLGHNVFMPNLVEVFAVEHRHFRLYLGEEPRFERVEKFTVVLQIIEDVAFLEFSTSVWQNNVLLMILHDDIARYDNVHFFRSEKQ